MTRPTGVIRRGSFLIEMIFALAIFVGASLAISTAIRQALTGGGRQRERIQAIDLAASAIAQLEAGISTVRELDGPAPAWTEPRADGLEPDGLPPESGWSLEVETERSGVSGLSLVTVHVRRDDDAPLGGPAAFAGEAPPIYTLRRLVRLARSTEEDVNPEDELLDALPPVEPGADATMSGAG